MQRVLLFRGKRVDNGNWVIGYYQGTETHAFIAASPFDIQVQVHPQTVGQYIGVKGYVGEYKTRHQNEVMLFEGDIVEARSEGSKGVFVITFRQSSTPAFMLYPAFQSKTMWSIAGSDLGRAPKDYYDDLKRLGNIHDSPELIKT